MGPLIMNCGAIFAIIAGWRGYPWWIIPICAVVIAIGYLLFRYRPVEQYRRMPSLILTTYLGNCFSAAVCFGAGRLIAYMF